MKKLLLSLFFSILSINLIFSYQVDLPGETTEIRAGDGGTTVEVSDTYYKNLSNKVNYYLWFIMGTVSLAVVIYAGFLLMSSNGDSNDLKKANKMLTWGLIGIFVALLSYMIVKLLIGLF